MIPPSSTSFLAVPFSSSGSWHPDDNTSRRLKSVGLPSADAPQGGPAAPALQARAGADFFDHVTISGALLGIAGGETARSFCGGGAGCTGNSSFRAVSGFAMLRLHSAGDWRAFAEGGIGPGHLISVSADNLFENPAQHDRGRPAASAR